MRESNTGLFKMYSHRRCVHPLHICKWHASFELNYEHRWNGIHWATKIYVIIANSIWNLGRGKRVHRRKSTRHRKKNTKKMYYSRFEESAASNWQFNLFEMDSCGAREIQRISIETKVFVTNCANEAMHRRWILYGRLSSPLCNAMHIMRNRLPKTWFAYTNNKIIVIITMHISCSLSSSSFACTRSIHARYDVTHVRCKLIARNRLFADFVTAMQPRLVSLLSLLSSLP